MDKEKMYKKIFKVIGDLTPLFVDCGQLCSCACCKGDEKTGMRLFPNEETDLSVTVIDEKHRLAVCDGTCNRESRPLACRIFPFFPAIDEKGKIQVVLDTRAQGLCPLLECAEEPIFDPKFLKAVKKVGKILKKDEECKEFLVESTEEINIYKAFLEKKGKKANI